MKNSRVCYLATFVLVGEFIFLKFCAINRVRPEKYLVLSPKGQWAGERSRYSDWLWAGWSGDRIPVEVRFSAPVQTGPTAPPSLLYKGYRVFRGGKERPGCDADHSPTSSAVVKKV